MNQSVLMKTNLPGLPPPRRGKVRDIYDLGEHLLIVATDRISAFDVVMANGIPGKGKILTQMSVFWFKWIGRTLPDIRTHFITDDWSKMVNFYPSLQPFQEQLNGRSMLVLKVKILPVEAVVRGYLYGSGWRDYQKTGETSGVRLPAGMKQADKLEEPIFTPATKAETGHDENIDWGRTTDLVGEEMAQAIKSQSLMLYQKATAYAESREIIIMDTKFEFGEDGAGIVLADEVLTPDSSRFARKEDWSRFVQNKGRKPEELLPSLDKQFLRDCLDELCAQGRWDKRPPGPELPADVVGGTRQRYEQALQMLIG